jgi:hypothetical protein
MPNRRMLTLTAEQEAELLSTRDHDKRPYMRERAAGLLKIAWGMSPHAVARTGLLKPRDPDTVYKWLNDYIRDGRLLPRPPSRGPFFPSGGRTPGRLRAAAAAGQSGRPLGLDAGADPQALS